MKRILTVLMSLMLLSSLSLKAQEEECPLIFDSCSFDFGTVNEADGTLFHEFAFINGSSAPVRISRVAGSCSCISISYPQTLIEGGEVSVVSVAFNPVGYMGEVVRYVEIYLGRDVPGVILEIKADIVPSDYDIEDMYKVAFPGGLRLTTVNAKFGYVQRGTSSDRRIDIVNTSSEPVSVGTEVADAASFLTVSGPRSLAPGEAGSLILRYSLPDSERAYGSHQDVVTVIVDGAACSRAIAVSCLGVDDLSGTKGPAPVLQAYPSNLKTVKIPLVNQYVTCLTLKNIGKSPLHVKKIEASDGSVRIDWKEGTVLAPGQSRKVILRSDVPSFTVGIVSDDRDRPYKEMKAQP